MSSIVHRFEKDPRMKELLGVLGEELTPSDLLIRVFPGVIRLIK